MPTEAESRPVKARRVFIECVLATTGLEPSVGMEQACDMILLRMAAEGVLVAALPEDVAERLALNDVADIHGQDTPVQVEVPDGADVQGDPQPEAG